MNDADTIGSPPIVAVVTSLGLIAAFTDGCFDLGQDQRARQQH
jgi:hypothetical protein